MPVSLSREEAYEYLNSRPGFMTVTTIDRRGYPHSVPIGYSVVGDDIYLAGRETSQRLKNVRRNPKMSVMIDSGSGMSDIKGLIVQGDAEVVDDPATCLDLLRDSMRRRGTAEDQLPKEPRPGIAYIRLRPRKFISWDYSRQA